MLKTFAVKSSSVCFDGMDKSFTEQSCKWDIVASYIRSVIGANPTITSANDGTHSSNSTHYKGLALDLRINDWKGNIKQHAFVIAWILGTNWLVLLEVDHLHIQYGFSNLVHPEGIKRIGDGSYIE